MRIPQRSDSKGSLKWLQHLNAMPSAPLNGYLAEALGLAPGVSITWRSPLPDDDYAEYRDAAFLRRLGLERLETDLAAFWPSLGPQWDGLATTSDGKVLLIEAKAHTGELVSSCGAGEVSLPIIERALAKTKAAYQAALDADWTTGFYQYANRLAHLHFLQEHGVDAHLVFIYFMNAQDMRGPANRAEWAPVLDECYGALGLARERGIPGVHSVYVDLDRVSPSD